MMVRYSDYDMATANMFSAVMTWLFLILVSVVLVLAAMALWKYINKK